MSTYSQYATHGMGGNDLVANESYAGAVGAYRAIEENSINEFRIFESVIGCDFADAFHKAGALNESTYESINESALGDIWEKVKAFFKKIGEKIMGILKKFKDRLVATFTRDGKELVRKFDKQILTKLNGDKMHHFKYKWSNIGIQNANKDCFTAAVLDPCVESDLSKESEQMFNDAKSADERIGKNSRKYQDGNNKEPVQKKIEELKNKYDEDFIKDGKEEIYAKFGNHLGGNLGHDCTKNELYDELVGESDWEEKEELSATDYTEIKSLLQNGGKAIKDLDSAVNTANKHFKARIKTCEELQKKYNKEASKEDITSRRVYSNTYATYCIKLTNAYTSAGVDCITTYSAAIKKVMSNARSIFVRAATFGGKDEATLMEAVDQVSNYEVEQMFE